MLLLGLIKILRLEPLKNYRFQVRSLSFLLMNPSGKVRANAWIHHRRTEQNHRRQSLSLKLCRQSETRIFSVYEIAILLIW